MAYIEYITEYHFYKSSTNSYKIRRYLLDCPVDPSIYIYIYTYPHTHTHHLPFCIVNTVLNQPFRQVRIPCLSKIAKNKLTFQEKAPVNSFRFDVSTLSTATLYSSIQKTTARHLGQVRREHAVNGRNQPCARENQKHIF